MFGLREVFDGGRVVERDFGSVTVRFVDGIVSGDDTSGGVHGGVVSGRADSLGFQLGRALSYAGLLFLCLLGLPLVLGLYKGFFGGDSTIVDPNVLRALIGLIG